MAQEVNVVGNKKIETVMKEFTAKFPYLMLIIFPLTEKNKKPKTPYKYSKKISEVRTKINPGKISIHGRTKVNNLESAFEEIFGLYVQVCYTTKDGGKFFTSGRLDSMGLTELNRYGESQGWKC